MNTCVRVVDSILKKFRSSMIHHLRNVLIVGKKSASRQVSMSSFHLKGGGWYKDGYSGKNTESEKTEKSGKEKTDDTDKKPSAKDKQSSSEKSGNIENKGSTSSKKSESTGKEKAA